MNRRLRWGILGTGLIAKRFAAGLKLSRTGTLAAVASRTKQSAEEFAQKFGAPRYHLGYQALLDDRDVDAVYISTPHPFHAEWAIKAAEAGKHILVEKPIAMNWHEATAMIDAARVNRVFLMEAFMYRCHPQMRAIREIVRSGRIGEVRAISACFSYITNAPSESRFFAQELGGGGILDVGCYPVSFARFVAGASAGTLFEDPIEVKACGTLGATGTDDWSSAVLKFSSGIVAQVSTGLRVAQDEVAHIYGSEGSVFVSDPWLPGRSADFKLVVRKNYAKDGETIAVETPNLYALEADAVADNLEKGEADEMNWNDSLGNMRCLDRWRREIGLVYDLEKPANVTQTITRRPLAVRPSTKMKYGNIAGLKKTVSRVIMGCDSNNTMPDTAILFDDFFERGGNAFDTSFAYGDPNGAPERNLGQWIRNRGIRDKVVVIEKGANPPHATPDGLTRELLAGLERLQMDCVDIYMIHRDNSDVPIGEWVDVLNEHWRAGRMKIFGVSNFTLPRVQAAMEYARQKGLESFRVISNQFSLARMLAPVWDLCVSANDPAFISWLNETQLPLLPWSSQARGFFTRRASRENTSSEEFNRCWYSDANFERKERANELASKKGVLPIHIALAYVLHQPFPTFPLIGPKQIAETRSSLEAFDVELTADERIWLDRGAG